MDQRSQRWPDRIGSTRFSTIRHVDETGSTNDDLVAEARAGGPDGRVLVADHQTAGRGRLGRTWQAPPGSSLLVSILLRPSLALDEVHLVATALGVAAVDTVADLGVVARLKWPNDLVVVGATGDHRKLSGMLAESVISGDRLDALVIGIGLNVNWPADLPPELASIATSLDRLVGHPVDRVGLLVTMLTAFEGRLRLLDDDGRRRLLSDYRTRSATIGHRVEVDLGHERFVGDAIDVTAEGHLLVVDDCPDRPRTVVAGDVVHVRH